MIRHSVFAVVCLAVLGVPPVAASECHGPVGEAETLWPIAVRLRPDPSIIPQRMMLALLEANPHAFSRNNVNALYAGSTLCFGPGDAIAFGEQAAIAEVGRHNREWRSGRAQGGAPPAPEPEPAQSAPSVDEEPAAPGLADAVGAFASRLAGLEDWIKRLESRSDPEWVEHELARLGVRVARIEDQIRVLVTLLVPEDELRGRRETEPMPEPAPQSEAAMEPMPEPAPQSEAAMEPMPEPAPQSEAAMEPMPEPAPQSEAAMEPMPEPAPQSEAAMEPMPEPAPQSEAAMEPMPEPAPQSEAAMEPMPEPAPQSEAAMEPMPEPAPQSEALDELTTEEVLARVAAWRERVGDLLKR